MKQSDDPKAFFEKFKFRLSSSRKHPKWTDETISFEGLEADYVSNLERDVEDLKNHVKELQNRIWWLQEKEYRKPFETLMKDDK